MSYTVSYSTDTAMFAEAYRTALIKGEAKAGENFQGALADLWLEKTKTATSKHRELLKANLWARQDSDKVPHSVEDRSTHAYDKNSVYPYGGTASQFWKQINEEQKDAFATFLGTLTTEDFIRLLISTKRPVLYAESGIYGDGWDWNPMEMHILGECGIHLRRVKVYDNGARELEDVKAYPQDEPMEAMYVYLPGLLLGNKKNQLTADASEVVTFSEDGKATLDEAAIYKKYEKRLLPALLHVNDSLKAKDEKGFCNIPGLGCGLFTGEFAPDVVKKHLKSAIKKLIEVHGEKLTHIKAICLDLFDGDTETVLSEKEGGVDFLLRPAEKTNLHHLAKPESFDQKYKDCVLVAFVAADAVSMPNNEALGSKKNRNLSDEATKGSCSNSSSVLYTDCACHYDEEDKAYRPTSDETFQKIITDKEFRFLPDQKDMQSYKIAETETKGTDLYNAFVATNREKTKLYRQRIIHQKIKRFAGLLNISENSEAYEALKAFFQRYTWVCSSNGYINLNRTVKTLRRNIKKLLDHEKIKVSPSAKTALQNTLANLFKQSDRTAVTISNNLIKALNKSPQEYNRESILETNEGYTTSLSDDVELRSNVQSLLGHTNNPASQVIALCDETYAFAAQYHQALIDQKATAGEDFLGALAERWIQTLTTSQKEYYQGILDKNLWARKAHLQETLHGRAIYDAKRDYNEKTVRNRYYPYGGTASEFWKTVYDKHPDALKSFLKMLTTQEFIDLLVSTKRPVIYAENSIYNDHWDWNAAELHILSDCVFVLPDVTVFDNGFRRPEEGKEDYYQRHPGQGMKSIYVYVPGILLANGKCQFTADASEVLKFSKKRNEYALDEEKFYAIYERRLLPALRQANRILADQKKQGFCNIPALGGGAFLGDYVSKKAVKNCLIKTVKRLIKEHHAELNQFKAICLDLYSMDGLDEGPSLTENYEGSKIDLLLAPAIKTKVPRLSEPVKFGQQYKDLASVVVVAADPVSAPDNEAKYTANGYTFRDKSDESACGCASNAEEKITNIPGKYDEGLRSFKPTKQNGASYRDLMIDQKAIFSRGPQAIVHYPAAVDKKYDTVYTEFTESNTKKINQYRQKEINQNSHEAVAVLSSLGQQTSDPDKKKIEAFYQAYTWDCSSLYPNLNPDIRKLNKCLREINILFNQADLKKLGPLRQVATNIIQAVFANTNKTKEAWEVPYQLLKGFDQKYFTDQESFENFLRNLASYSKSNTINIALTGWAGWKLSRLLFDFYQKIDAATDSLNLKFPPGSNDHIRRQFMNIQEKIKLYFYNFIIEGDWVPEKINNFKAEIEGLVKQAEGLIGGKNPLAELNSSISALVSGIPRVVAVDPGINTFLQDISKQYLGAQDFKNVDFQFDDSNFPTIISFPGQGMPLIPQGLEAQAKLLFVITSEQNRIKIKLTPEGCKKALLDDIVSALKLTEAQHVGMKYILTRSKNPSLFKHWFSCCLFRSVSRTVRLNTACETTHTKTNISPQSSLKTVAEFKGNYEDWSSASRQINRLTAGKKG